MNKQDVLAAIDENRLFLHLQPVVSTSTHRPMFHEALLRMKTNSGAVISAVEFVEGAEQQNYVYDIDLRTLQLAIELLEKHPGFDLSLNISGLTTADFAWITMLDQLTNDRRALSNRIIVEITETAALSDINRTRAFIDALKDHGCRVAVDDYGAGYTNFTNLNLLAPDIVKIDSTYVQSFAQSDSRAFLAAVIELGQTMRFETVAEGVETEACAIALTKLGATYLQGFWFAEPSLPAEALAWQMRETETEGQERS